MGQSQGRRKDDMFHYIKQTVFYILNEHNRSNLKIEVVIVIPSNLREFFPVSNMFGPDSTTYHNRYKQKQND